MILFLNTHASLHAIEQLQNRLTFMGFDSTLEIDSNHKRIVVINGIDENTNILAFETLPLVEKVVPINEKLKLTGKEIKTSNSIIDIKGCKIGGNEFIVMAGPCSIESKQQIYDIAQSVKQSGAKILRGGAFKPRTSPYDFQGLGEEGLRYLREASNEFDLLCISEVMSVEDLELVSKYVDILQLGARNMQNFSLLKAVGKMNKPVLLKRGLSATYKEFLSAAEYIIASGNPNVILCERGIRTFETYSRNTLDLAAVPILKSLTHLPIIVDPSHGVGLREIVPYMAHASIAIQANGLIVEVHTHPEQSISDAAQTISTTTFDNMMTTLSKIGDAVGMHVNRKHA